MADKLWSTEQLAEEATQGGRPVTSRTLRRWCVSGKLPAYRVGRTFVITDQAARAFLAVWLSEVSGDDAT